MDIQTKDDHKLFWTVDVAWNNDGIIVTFPLKHGDEARNRIVDLGPWVHHFKGARAITKYFTPAAVERALNSTWDSENDREISQEEEELDGLIKRINDDMGFLGDPNSKTEVDMSQVSQQVDGTNLRPTNLFNYDPAEDESLGTFGQTTAHGDEQPVFNLTVQ